jgi:hypothetical protein
VILDRVAPTKVDRRIFAAELRGRDAASEVVESWARAIHSCNGDPPKSLLVGYNLAIEVVDAVAEFSQKQVLAERLRWLASAMYCACECARLARRLGSAGTFSGADVESMEEQLDSVVRAAAEIIRVSMKDKS